FEPAEESKSSPSRPKGDSPPLKPFLSPTEEGKREMKIVVTDFDLANTVHTGSHAPAHTPPQHVRVSPPSSLSSTPVQATLPALSTPPKSGSPSTTPISGLPAIAPHVPSQT